MMPQQTLDKLHALRWFGLAEAWRKQMESPEIASLSFDERLGLHVRRKMEPLEKRWLQTAYGGHARPSSPETL